MRAFLSALIIPFCCCVPAFAQAGEEEVAAAVKAFLKSVRDKNLKEIMQHVEVPWLAEKEKTIADRKELERLWETKLKTLKPETVAKEILGVRPFAELKADVRDPRLVKLLEPVLKKDGLLVLAGDKDELRLGYVLVRMDGKQPRVVGGPYSLTYLLQPNEIPKAALEALERAENWELLSLAPDRREKDENAFHGWKVLGKTMVKDAKTRDKLRSAFLSGVEENSGLVAACFNPRHGIRLSHEGKTVDLVICFECFQVHVFAKGERDGGVLITRSPQPAFDEALRAAGVPLPKKAEE